MSCYNKNKKTLLKKAHEKYHNGGGNEKAAKFYQKNKEKITEKERKIYNSMTDIE